eukprot:2725249-Prymnesium_polylepis.1
MDYLQKGDVDPFSALQPLHSTALYNTPSDASRQLSPVSARAGRRGHGRTRHHGASLYRVGIISVSPTTPRRPQKHPRASLFRVFHIFPRGCHIRRPGPAVSKLGDCGRYK